MRKLSLKTGGKYFADTSPSVFADGGGLHTNYIDSMKRMDQTNITNPYFSICPWKRNLSVTLDCKKFFENL